MKNFIWAGVIAVGLTACSSTPTLYSTGGSRADATVEMSYEYGMFEVPEINIEQGRVEALQRCKAWGYSEAEPFGGQRKQCNSMSSSGCVAWVATITYQCTG